MKKFFSFRTAIGMAVALVTTGFVVCHAQAFDGLVVSELPLGGDVTIPSDYPVMVPKAVDVVFSSVNGAQALNISNKSTSVSVVKLFAVNEQATRTIRLTPGATTIYNLKNQMPIRLRVLNGDVRVSSIQPLKIQR